MPKTVNMVADGRTVAVPEGQVEEAIRQGFVAESSEGAASRVTKEFRDDTYGGTLGKVAAGAAGVARGVTLGLSDAALGALGEGEEFRRIREVNPGISTATEIGGALLTAVPTGGGSLAAMPSAAAARLGSRIAKGSAGAGTLAKVGRGVAGGAIEGAITGAGAGVSELALSQDPLTLERAASVLTSNALYGGAIGGGVGGVAKVAEVGLLKAKRAIDQHAAAQATRATVTDDLLDLDAKGLNAARDAELEAIETGRAGTRSTVASEVAAHRAAVKERKIWLATKGAADRETRELGKISLDADRTLDRVLRNPKALAENPKPALSGLQQEEHALERILATKGDAARIGDDLPDFAKAAGDETVSTVRASSLKANGFHRPPGVGDDAAKMEKARRAIAEGQRDPITIVVSPKGKYFVEDGRHRLDAALEADAPIKVKWQQGDAALDGKGKKLGEAFEAVGGGGLSRHAREAVDAIPEALERNRSLQAKIKDLAGAPKSERLAAISNAKDALMTGGRAEKGIPEQMLQGSVFSAAAGAASAIPIVGPMIAPFIGAKASKYVAERVFGGIGKASTNMAVRTQKAVAAFLDTATTGLRATPVLASRVLASVRYAQSDETKAPKSTRLADVYRARADEVRSQTAYGPDGRSVMRPDARAKMAARLVPIGAVDPIAADRLETAAARRIEFLANKLPRRPDLAGIPTGPDKWQPSDMAMRTWARYAAAAEDPHGIVERLAAGTITPEDAETMRTVYPELFADVQRQIVEKLPELREQLPYSRRLSLSIFSGVPVDPAMDPRILGVLQSQFTEEPGTEGGTQAPKPQAAFGSVKAAPGTPSQERAEPS